MAWTDTLTSTYLQTMAGERLLIAMTDDDENPDAVQASVVAQAIVAIVSKTKGMLTKRYPAAVAAETASPYIIHLMAAMALHEISLRRKRGAAAFQEENEQAFAELRSIASGDFSVSEWDAGEGIDDPGRQEKAEFPGADDIFDIIMDWPSVPNEHDSDMRY